MLVKPAKMILSVALLSALLTVTFRLSSQESRHSTDSIQPKNNTLLKAASIATGYYAASIVVLGQTWYKDRERVPFHFYNDNRGYLQVDKFGHMFGSYVYSYIGYNYLLHAGYSRNQALCFGASLGFVLQAPIEIMDGVHEGYGFSWGDMVANALGSALIIGQELAFNQQVIKYKFSYRESGYASQAHGYLGKNAFDRIFKDYNGHTYWLTLPLSGALPIKKLPRWLNIAVGYGANGMYGEFENITSYNGMPIPETVRYRQYLLSLDIDCTKIPVKSELLKTLLHGLNFIKIPLPTLEYNSLGRFQWHWFY
jgi:uncharacterized protein YfiM (DUF2279 family)